MEMGCGNRTARRRIMRVAAALVAILSCPAAELEHRIDALIETSSIATRAEVGIHVVALANGKTLYGHNENRLLLPASNMKLFTTALALDRLGGAYRFMTRPVGLRCAGKRAYRERQHDNRHDPARRPPGRSCRTVAVPGARILRGR